MRSLTIGCLLILCTLMAIPAAAQSADDAVRVRVFAHFVSWYSQQRPGINDHQWGESSLFPIPPHRGPGVGEGYASVDPAIIALQNQDFMEYGITPLASWWGPGHGAGDDFIDAYLAVPSEVKIGLLYEVTGLLKDTSPADDAVGLFDMSDSENVERFTEHIGYLKSRYFDTYPERFIRIDDKPVVFIWLSGLFRGDFERATAAIRDDVYLIGSEIGPYPPGASSLERLPIIRGLDALSSYGVQFQDFHSGRLDAAFVGQLLSSFRLWAQWLSVHAPGVAVIPPLSFASNDTGIPEREPHARPFYSTKNEATYAAEQYRTFLSEVYDGCAVRNILPIVNITSYNELVEGTAMEASQRNVDIPQPFPIDFGNMYLEVVRDVLRQPIAYAERRCPQ